MLTQYKHSKVIFVRSGPFHQIPSHVSNKNELHLPVSKNHNTEMLRTQYFDKKPFLNASTFAIECYCSHIHEDPQYILTMHIGAGIGGLPILQEKQCN